MTCWQSLPCHFKNHSLAAFLNWLCKVGWYWYTSKSKFVDLTAIIYEPVAKCYYMSLRSSMHLIHLHNSLENVKTLAYLTIYISFQSASQIIFTSCWLISTQFHCFFLSKFNEGVGPFSYVTDSLKTNSLMSERIVAFL